MTKLTFGSTINHSGQSEITMSLIHVISKDPQTTARLGQTKLYDWSRKPKNALGVYFMSEWVSKWEWVCERYPLRSYVIFTVADGETTLWERKIGKMLFKYWLWTNTTGLLFCVFYIFSLMNDLISQYQGLHKLKTEQRGENDPWLKSGLWFLEVIQPSSYLDDPSVVKP